jgi:hypothetical protein
VLLFKNSPAVLQLLGKNYLSLAEVQVIGVDPEVQVVDIGLYKLKAISAVVDNDLIDLFLTA